MFNDYIKQDDIVCMPLYRRVYPQWYEKTWNPEAAEPINKKDIKYQAEEQEEKVNDE
jgi:hypothetical protein